jgi:hypothetical protein
MKRGKKKQPGTESEMRRASFFLPADLRDRLAAESQRSGVPIAELVRRYLEATVPPVAIGFGKLRRFVDRDGLLKVRVLSAREGKLLVNPGDDFNNVELWVDADLVRLEDPLPVIGEAQAESLVDGLKLNIKISDEPAEPKS